MRKNKSLGGFIKTLKIFIIFVFILNMSFLGVFFSVENVLAEDPCYDQGGDSDGDGVCDNSDICLPGDDNVDTDADGIPDDCDDCEDIDGDGYGLGSGCLGTDCNPTSFGMQDRLCCYVDQDNDFYYNPYSYVSNDGVARGEFCYCTTDSEISSICSDLTEATVLGEDCDDDDETRNVTCIEGVNPSCQDDTDCMRGEICNDGFCMKKKPGIVEKPEEGVGPEIATIKAYKVVCDYEYLLPDWHDGSDITDHTASDYVAEVDGCNWVQDDWIFEWGENELSYNGDYVGSISELESSWEDFDSVSNGSAPAEVEIVLNDGVGDGDGKIWFREELKEGYAAFSIPPGDLPGSDVSAEFYCDMDVEHYNNMEEISVDSLSPDDVRYCVAFNVIEPARTCEEGDLVEFEGYVDFVDIGAIDSEMGHNLSLWSDEWVKPGWGGNYGGGSEDESFRLLMGPGDGCGSEYESASLTFDVGSTFVDKIVFEHLDGSVDDSFDVYINDVKIGHYTGGQNQGETWVESSYNFLAVTGTVTVKFVATEPDNEWCANWGQVAFSWVGLEGYSCETDQPECGDGVLDEGEECDDNNNDDWDGCDSQCNLEPSIYGCKYNDLNNNGLIDEEPTMSGWTIQLVQCPYILRAAFVALDAPVVGECTVQYETTTDSEGCYEFVGIEPGDYRLQEVMQDNWTQTYPGEAGYYTLYYGEGELEVPYDFANYREPSDDTYCGDGIVQTPNDHGFSEECDGSAPSGYTCNSDCTLKQNSTSGGGGDPGYSGGGEFRLSTGDTVEEVTVLGEEGAPVLTISVTVNKEVLNQGDEFEYEIIVSNAGNLTAFDVNLTDLLPEGIVYEDPNQIATWALGDMAAGESKTTVVKVKAGDSSLEKVYNYSGKAVATNHDAVEDDVDVIVEIVKVLAATGFSMIEFAGLLTAFFSLIGASYALKRKMTV